MEMPEIGESLTAPIDKISKSGNGIIKTDSGWLNIGPVTQNSVGTRVKVVREYGNFARCITDGVKVVNYDDKFSELMPFGDLPKPGTSFTGEIVRISGSGNGIIEWNGGEINIGPVYEDSVGEEIEAVMVRGNFAYCKTSSVRVSDYAEQFINTPDVIKPIEKTTTSASKSDSPDGDISLTGDIQFCPECGSILYNNDSLMSCSSCEYTNSESRENPTKGAKQEAHSDHVSSSSEPVQTDSDQTKQTPSTEHTNIAKTSEEVGNRDKIDKLREKAEANAVEEVPEEAITATQATPEYSRSSAVIEYVKARANGVCEGCGEPAPFLNKAGKPYFHAHHIHELSNGGSDTPDTVIALCPNCHYRVHHGEDGELYNQELAHRLSLIEDSPSEK